MTAMTRRDLLAAGAAACAALQISGPAWADSPAPVALEATRRTIDVNGRAASVWGLLRPDGGQGLVLEPGERFRVDLRNGLDEPSIVHWHGQIPPNVQDGVPGMPMAALRPGETRSYDFAARPGTHWMHSHIPMQEMRLLAAPLIVRSPADAAEDRQEVVLFLHDFSFKEPGEVLEEIAGGHGGDGHGAHGTAGPASMGHGAHGAGSSAATGHDMPGMEMGGMAMDINDHDWDAYLANDRTLDDPDVVTVERGGHVRLRVINAAAATVFWIDTGAVQVRLVAADGHPVQPLQGSRFGIAMGQRLDLEIDLPGGSGAWPVLALREGARERTGLILATAGAAIGKIGAAAADKAPAFDTDLTQESQLAAVGGLPGRPVDRSRMLMLGGSMQPYVWTIDGQVWGRHAPVRARTGERVELTFHNMSMMGHPMHLHGHTFQVTGINGSRIAGALRDTVYVPPMSMVTVALDAGEAARWMLHCHHMPHLATGMMTEFEVSDPA